MRSVAFQVPRSLMRFAGFAAAMALSALVSCAEPEQRAETAETTARDDPAADATTGARQSAGADKAAMPGVDPASGVLPPKEMPQAAPDPRTIGLEPAKDVRSDPALAADAGTGEASAFWGRRGRKVDSKSPWRSIAGDGLHDRSTEAVRLLQNPGAALRGFPRANSGNLVDWVAALDQGHIRPRGGGLEVLETDVLLVDTKTMPVVVFPHRPHTEQLVCGNCHDWLFKKEAGATDITMADIARGRSCGMCHGKVAFPATECFRCHSGPRPK